MEYGGGRTRRTQAERDAITVETVCVARVVGALLRPGRGVAAQPSQPGRTSPDS